MASLALTRALALLAGARCMSASIALAQPRTVDDGAWTEARVVARAAQRSPEVARSRTALYEAHALSMFSRLPRVGNPTVGVRAMVGVPDVPAATYALLVGMPIDLSGARAQWSDEARWAVREAEFRVDVALNDACAQAREAFSDAAIAQATIALFEQRRETADALVRAARARLAAQSATALDVALAEQEASAAELSLLDARREREAALGRLRELLALTVEERISVSPIDEPTMPVGLSRERAASMAIARRRESASLRAAAQRLRASSTRLHHEATAPLFVAAEVEWQGYSVASLGVSAQWSLPVSLTNQGERATAQAQARAADEQRSIAELAVANQAAAAWTELELRLSELALLRTRSIPAAQRALDLTEALFRAGTIDSYRLLRARDELYAQQQRRLDAMRSAWRARVQLDRAIGNANTP
jgi:cobalt-zinc-cadmium efflux system outer membrane protein